MDSFENLEDVFRKIMRFSVLRVDEEPLEKTRFQRIFVLNANICGWTTDFLFVGFVYCFRNDLMKLLTHLEYSLVSLYILAIHFLFFRRREVLAEVLDWCKSRHTIENPDQRRICWLTFDQTLRDCQTGIRWLTRSFFCVFCTCSFGIEIIKYVFGDDPFPLPFYMHVFGLPATSLWSFCLNFWIQVFGIAFDIITVVIFHIWMLVAFRHVFASLEATLLAIEDMEDVVQNLSFDGWLEIVHSFLIDSTRYFKKIDRISSVVIYIEQKTMITVLFVGYLTLKIDPSNLPLACCSMFFVVVIFCMCNVNESFKQKYKDINFAIYELPWYELKPNERRLLVPLMVAAQNHPVLRAGGLDEMTFDNFLDYIKGAYSMAILMERLIFSS